jgi:hypothetical protein
LDGPHAQLHPFHPTVWKFLDRCGSDGSFPAMSAPSCDRRVVILRTGDEQAKWLTAPWIEARKLQRPLADGELEIVHRLPYKELPGVGFPTGGDPLRIPSPPKEPTLF